MMRLSRYLARAGAASRRGSEQLILDDRVSVNGRAVRELGTKVDEGSDEVRLDGRLMKIPAQGFTIMLNKPAGYVTTMDDPQGRPTVAQLVPLGEHPSLFPVGRLDRDTTGLLLFTTDGDLGQALLHPSREVGKRYLARIHGEMTEGKVARLRAGVDLDGRTTAPAQVELVRGGPEPVYAVTIHEGRNRQVRRMFEAVGCSVAALHRESIGPLRLGDLESGAWRPLADEELATLRAASAATA